MSKNIIQIAILGVNEVDAKKLTSIFWLSVKHPSRQHGYELVADVGHAQIVIVNADSQSSIMQWRDQYASKVAVMLSEDASSQTNFHLTKPLVATTVLRTLDEIDLEKATAIANNESVNDDSGMVQPKVLVVDDSLPIRKRMQIELQALEFNVVDFADCYISAMDYLKLSPYDMVFLDVVLPDGDGYQICKSIKGNSDTKATKVIMLTGKTSPFDKVKGKLSGCDSYLTKPVDRATLQKTIQRYFA